MKNRADRWAMKACLQGEGKGKKKMEKKIKRRKSMKETAREKCQEFSSVCGYYYFSIKRIHRRRQESRIWG